MSNAPLSPTAATVRRHDRERYLAALFAPADRREALFALYAFNYEVAKTREMVSETTLGRIRLEWWRETIDGIYAGGKARAHYVAEPLAEAVRRFGLARTHFDRLLDARESDLDDAPPPTLAALETYVEATSGTLVLLALEALGAARAEAAGRHAGVAFGLAGLLRAIPFHARARRSYVPAELLPSTRDLFERRPTPALREAARRIADEAGKHLQAVREAAEVSRAALPALLPGYVADQWLRRLAGAGYDPFAPSLRRGPALLPLRLALAARRGRI